MFCGNCGTPMIVNGRFCVKCGQGFKQDLNQTSSSNATQGSSEGSSEGSFGRVKAYIDFKRSKGKQWKESVSKKGKGKKCKQDEAEGDQEVIIFIGLMEWNENSDCLKKKHGKRLALKVNKKDPPAALLEKASQKWKAFFSNCYEDDEEYYLLLEDFKEATFLPGSNKEFFTVERYHEELGKDYKRITLYLCTKSNFLMQEGATHHEGDQEDEDQKDEEQEDEEQKDKEQKDGTVFPEGILGSTVRNDQEASCSNWKSTDVKDQQTEDQDCNAQIEHDRKVAQALQASLDNDNDDCTKEKNPLLAATCSQEMKDPTSVIKALEECVLSSCKFYITLRRAVPLERVISLWQRERKRKSPLNAISVKYLGEDGIDTGALAREFFADVVAEIGHRLFPEGSPINSTLYVQNGTFRTAGEIVAASLAQNGPPPNFLEEAVFDTLVNFDVDITSLAPGSHLSPKERQTLDNIKADLSQHHDMIIDHGYTGAINEENMDDIIGTIVVSIWNKRVLFLKEFKEGLAWYGLKSLISHSPHACKPLFVKGHLKHVDANYLVGLLHPEFSPNGTSRRCAEDNVLDHFQDLLLGMEDDPVTGYSAPLAWNYKCEDSQDEVLDDSVDEIFKTPELDAAGVMGWLTGQRHREITGRKLMITVRFDHDCMIRNPNHKICFPYVGSCGMEITFPVKHMNSFDDFKHVFLLAYCKGQAFAMH